MDHLEQKKDAIQSLAEIIEPYNVKLYGLLENSKSRVIIIKELYDNIVKALSQIKNIKISSDISDVFRYFSLVELMHVNIGKLHNLFNDIQSNKLLFESSVSETYKNELNAMYRALLTKLSKYYSNVEPLDDIILMELARPIMSDLRKSKDILQDFQNIRSVYHKYPDSVSLYANICQKLIDYLNETNRALMLDVSNLLEMDKTLSLDSKYYKIEKAKIKKNPIMRTFGLIPIGQMLSATQVNELVFSQKTASFDGASKKHKTCIVIINKLTSNPIYCDIDKLINPNIASQYVQNDLVGINPTIIERLYTVVKLESKTKWEFSVSFHGSDTLESFLILETYDKNTYRILATRINPHTYVIPKKKIAKFIAYMKQYDAGKLVPGRIDLYNKNLTSQILPNMFFTHFIDIDALITESTEVDARYLRNTLFSRLSVEFKKRAKSVKSNADLGKIIYQDVFVEIFSDVLIEYYEEYKSRNIMKRHKFRYAELLVDFLYDLKDLTKIFSKELQTNYNEMEPSGEIYTKYKEGILQMELQKIFEDIINKSLEKIVIDKKNLYQSMVFKDKLLSI